MASKNVVVLKETDVTRRGGYVAMPNTIEMAQIKKPEKEQFKTQICLSSNMTEEDVNPSLVKAAVNGRVQDWCIP